MKYTMNDIIKRLDISYATLKYYCNEGLIPNHTRDDNNYRIFDQHDSALIEGLLKLRNCKMSIKDMKKYVSLVYQGPQTIKARKMMLQKTKQELLKNLELISASLEFVEDKISFYDDVIDGKIEYRSEVLK